MTEISLSGRGARGESQADILRRTGQFGVLPTDTDAAVFENAKGASVQTDADTTSTIHWHGQCGNGSIFLNTTIDLQDANFARTAHGWHYASSVTEDPSFSNEVPTPYKGGTVPPATGTHVAGAEAWHSAPAAATAPGWVCVTAGTPGTWKAMADLAA